jgi:hypothetical protein
MKNKNAKDDPPISSEGGEKSPRNRLSAIKQPPPSASPISSRVYPHRKSLFQQNTRLPRLANLIQGYILPFSSFLQHRRPGGKVNGWLALAAKNGRPGNSTQVSLIPTKQTSLCRGRSNPICLSILCEVVNIAVRSRSSSKFAVISLGRLAMSSLLVSILVLVTG